MPDLDYHPSVLAVKSRSLPVAPISIAPEEMRVLCKEAGAADVGFVSLDRPEMDDERTDIQRLFPATQTLVCIVCRMNPDSVRSPLRSVANHEFHETGDEVNEVARNIVSALAARGIRAVNPPMAFPMEMDKFPEKIWSISLKPLAVAAGLGRIGLHRNVIHPKFGSFILLGVVLVNAKIADESRQIDFNPCLTCKLCVAACPVGAISPEGEFNFSSCYTHNYREFMNGFTDWVETVADSRNNVEYRNRVTDAESVSMWQSLAYGPNYKAAYCLSACPAGEDVIMPFLKDRASFVSEVVKPLQRNDEMVYVQKRSDAETYVKKRFPHKRLRYVGAVLRPNSIRGFIRLMRHGFQPIQSKGVSARYHFTFTGDEPAQCTVLIRDQKIHVQEGLHEKCDVLITSSSGAWLRLLRKEASIAWLLCSFQVRIWGNPSLLAAFGRCFP